MRTLPLIATRRPNWIALLLAFMAGRALAQSLPPRAIQQIQALIQEKQSRTPAQQKLSSHLHYAAKMRRGIEVAPGILTLASSLEMARVDAQGMVVVDIKADVTPGVLVEIGGLGGQVISAFTEYRAIRARMPLLSLEKLAARPDVSFIEPEERAATDSSSGPGPMRLRGPETMTRAEGTRAERAAQVRVQLARALPLARTRRGRLGRRLGLSFTRPLSQGDVAHAADQVRKIFPTVDGRGVNVGVLSDGVDSLAALQASGDLPNNVTVAANQGGSGDEGSAMLEIVYDLAPGASLFFATGSGGASQMATNIKTLRNMYHCDIIMDDVNYSSEGVFQDDKIAQAVNDVTLDGALYFSSAGNAGSLDSKTSGVWEGDFADSGLTFLGGIGLLNSLRFHTFGNGATADAITVGNPANFGTTLKWSDPLGKSGNDYDLYVFDSTMANIVASSTNLQNGSQDPVENVGQRNAGEQLVVVLFSGNPRALNLTVHRGQLSIATSGQTYGHHAAGSAVTVGAVNVATAGGGAFTGGAANPVETYSSDGLRRIFYNPDGTEITPGNVLFSSNGGTVLQKPDIAAADCTAGAAPGFASFCGTSAATPHAGAIAALVKSAQPSFTAAQIKAAMEPTALDIMAAGTDRHAGFGLVMAKAAVEAILAVNITIDSSPHGLSFTVSGTDCSAGSYPTPKTLQWFAGQTCTATFSTPQAGGPGTQYAFSAWADAAAGASRAFTVPASDTTYTADFNTQYFLTTLANPVSGGTISGAGFYDGGTSTAAFATATAPFMFSSFSLANTYAPAPAIAGRGASSLRAVSASGRSHPLRETGPGRIEPRDFSCNNCIPVLMDAPKTVTANFVVATTTMLANASVQYSDSVTLSATVSPVSAGGQTATGTVQFAVDGKSAGSASINGAGVATLSVAISVAAGGHTITAQFSSTNAYFTNSNGSATLTVSREDAAVTPWLSNPTAVKVNSPGGTAGPITLAAAITELNDDTTQGNISNATPVTFTMVPVLPGTTLNCTATTSGGGVGGTLNASCTFNSVPVNVYDVTISIGGSYYTGSVQIVLATYDPSLGFVTGGGTILRNGAPAQFGFNFKYLKKGNPQGALLYIENRKAGQVILKSNSVQSLSIVGNQAAALSKATLNGVGNYGFQAIVIDNGEPGTSDQFGLCVTGPNGAIIPDLTFSPITLSSGNIQVPH